MYTKQRIFSERVDNLLRYCIVATITAYLNLEQDFASLTITFIKDKVCPKWPHGFGIQTHRTPQKFISIAYFLKFWKPSFETKIVLHLGPFTVNI